MFRHSAFLTVAALATLAFLAQPVSGKEITTLKPPSLIPFVHMNLKVEASTYINETNGIITGQANNQGGNFTGNITGTVLKLGTEFETYPTAAMMATSTYINTFNLNTTDGVPILLEVAGNIHYSPHHLVGFSRMVFSTDSPKYQYLSFGDYVAEFEAYFPSGKVSVDIFQLKSNGDY